MGTHPIFESDFDCLTELSRNNKALKEALNERLKKNQKRKMDLLVTGGAGFIGSHTVVELLTAGHKVTVIDNCSNTAPPRLPAQLPPSLARVARIVGPVTARNLVFYHGDITSHDDLRRAFGASKDAVIHFAGLKAVGESKSKPLSYYRVNHGGTVNVLEVMAEVNCKKIVFSSSATVYKPVHSLEKLPLTEHSATGATTNPYARSKLHVEEMLRDMAAADSELSVVNLRYFNPVGAHPSGLIGEDPSGTPNNLMPFISQVAIGRRKHLNVFGSDYETPDGTGMRDYIHVVDLAKGHLAALNRLLEPGFEVYNLGTGTATTVLQLVNAFKSIAQVEIPFELVERRPGDVAWLWCSPTKALEQLKWEAELSITDMCRDMWRFQTSNPMGYEEPLESMCSRSMSETSSNSDDSGNLTEFSDSET